MITIDNSILLGYYNSRAGILSGATTGTSTTGAAATTGPNAAVPAPTAPWSSPSTAPNATTLAKSVLAGHNFINVNAAQLDVRGASDDYKNLFALYSGLDAMAGLANQASQPGVSPLQLDQLQKTFASGMSQISSFVGSLKTTQVRLTVGQSLLSDKTTIGVPATDTTYTTRTVYTGDPTQPVPAFQGDVSFNIAIKQVNSTKQVPISLDDMGSTARTLNNVVDYINTQLKAAGVLTRFGISKQPAAPQTIQVGKQTVTLPAAAPSYALQVNGDTSKSVTFSAAATAGAVYVSQTAGAPPTTTTTVTNGHLTTTTSPDTQTQQLLKIQTDTSTTPDQPPAPVVPAGTPYNVDGKVFSSTLDPNVTTVHATATGADGSVYVLGDVNGTVNGQAIQGSQDVALMKYDSAGNLLYARTLGAADSASGLALAVSATGQVAVAGSTTGPIDTSTSVDDPTKSDSFVTVFDAQGQEQWTSVRGTRENDQATAVAFGADGSVYVAGQASSNMPGAAEVGGQDGYLEGFMWNGKSGDALEKVATEFTTQFGSTGTDKVAGMAVNGSNIVVAGTDGADAVVRQFALNPTGAPTLTATRDLGDLQGGSVAGVGYDSNGQIIVAGAAHNAALDAGTVTNASSGGSDAFVARLAPGLAPSASDTVAYYGGSGNDTVTGMAIQGTSVWLAGQVGSDLPGTTPIGSKDGYVAQIDPSTGQASFIRRFTAAQGQTQTTSIAVSANGSSALDRLGLPTGKLTYTDSPLLTAATSLRAGDTFQVRSQQGGAATTVTITADDTMDTLAQKIARASDYRATATILTLNGQKQLQIKAANSSDSVEILPGPAGSNALLSLGLNEGVIHNLPPTSSTSASASAKPGQKTFGIGLDPSLNLSTAAGATAAASAMQSAMATIRSAYSYISTASQPAAATNPGKTGGPVPQYLTDQIANYTAALQRLTGGSSS